MVLLQADGITSWKVPPLKELKTPHALDIRGHEMTSDPLFSKLQDRLPGELVTTTLLVPEQWYHEEATQMSVSLVIVERSYESGRQTQVDLRVVDGVVKVTTKIISHTAPSFPSRSILSFSQTEEMRIISIPESSLGQGCVSLFRNDVSTGAWDGDDCACRHPVSQCSSVCSISARYLYTCVHPHSQPARIHVVDILPL